MYWCLHGSIILYINGKLHISGPVWRDSRYNGTVMWKAFLYYVVWTLYHHFSGCTYGDHSGYCKAISCEVESNRDLCCQTCQSFLTTTPTPTTPTTTTPTTISPTTTTPTTTKPPTTTTTPPGVCRDIGIDGKPCHIYIIPMYKSLCYDYADVCCVTCAGLRDNDNPSKWLLRYYDVTWEP